MAKRVLITGGSRGIGAATVARFYEQGWQVAFCYRSHHEEAERLQQQYPGTIGICADVSDAKQVAELFERAIVQLGGLDALVCNAGVALPQKLLTDISEAEYDLVMNVNVRGTVLCCKQAASYMVSAHSGAIVTLSSIWGEKGGSCETVYSASKGAIVAFSKALAKELGPSGIRVNCVCPGVIDTQMNAHLSAEDKQNLADETSLMRLGTACEVADVIEFLCSDRAGYITAQTIGVDGGIW